MLGGGGISSLPSPRSSRLAKMRTCCPVAGTVVLWIDGVEHPLAEGDSATFDADLPHHLSNEGDAEARLLAVVSSGLRGA